MKIMAMLCAQVVAIYLEVIVQYAMLYVKMRKM